MLSYHRSMGEGLAGSEAPVSVCSSGLPASSAPSSSITIAIDQPSDQSSRPPEEPDSGLQRSPRPRPPRAPQADCSPRLDDPDRWLVSAQLRNVKEKSIKVDHHLPYYLSAHVPFQQGLPVIIIIIPSGHHLSIHTYIQPYLHTYIHTCPLPSLEVDILATHTIYPRAL